MAANADFNYELRRSEMFHSWSDMVRSYGIGQSFLSAVL